MQDCQKDKLDGKGYELLPMRDLKEQPFEEVAVDFLDRLTLYHTYPETHKKLSGLLNLNVTAAETVQLAKKIRNKNKITNK